MIFLTDGAICSLQIADGSAAPAGRLHTGYAARDGKRSELERQKVRRDASRGRQLRVTGRRPVERTDQETQRWST